MPRRGRYIISQEALALDILPAPCLREAEGGKSPGGEVISLFERKPRRKDDVGGPTGAQALAAMLDSWSQTTLREAPWYWR